MNRAKLYQLCRRYGHRDFTDEELADALVTARARIGRDLRTIWNAETAVLQMAAGLRYGQSIETAMLPADYRSPRTISDNASGARYEVRGSERFRERLLGSERENVALLSKDSIAVAPATSGGELLLEYHREPAELTDTDDPRSVASVFPDVYIHGTLMECEQITADDAAYEAAAAKYAAAVDLANVADAASEYDMADARPDTVIGG